MRWRGLSGTACPVRRPSPCWTVTSLRHDCELRSFYLKGREGDAANVVLNAIGHNRAVLAWLKAFLHSMPCAGLFRPRSGSQTGFDD